MEPLLKFFLKRNFSSIFWTQFFGAFNDNVLKNALIILITFESLRVFGLNSELMVVAAGGIFILPFFLFSGLAGQLADKFNKTKIIHIIKIAEVVIMIGATIGFYFKHMEWLFFCLFLMGLHSAFFGPIKYSIIPQLVAPNNLLRANGLFSAGTFVAILLGTLTGGLVITSQPRELWTSLTLVLLALFGLGASYFIPQQSPLDPHLKINPNPFTTTWSVLKMVKPHKSLYAVILGTSWFWFFGASVLAILPLFVKNLLHGDESVVTFFLAFFSVGVGIGSVLVNRFSKGKLKVGLVPLGALLMLSFILALANTNVNSVADGTEYKSIILILTQPDTLFVTLNFILLSIVCGFYIVPQMTLLQERSIENFRSRIIGAGNILNSLFMVVSSLVLMLLFKLKFNIQEIFLVLAILHTIFSLVLFWRLMPEFLLNFYSMIWIQDSESDYSRPDHLTKSGSMLMVLENKTWFEIIRALKKTWVYPDKIAYIKGSSTSWIEMFLLWQIGANAYENLGQISVLNESKMQILLLKENSQNPEFLTQLH